MIQSRTRTAAVVFAGFCAFLTLYAPQPLLPMLSKSFGVPAAAVVYVITASTVAVAIAAPFVGAVADRFGRKRVIVPATFLLAAATMASGFSGGLGHLVFWRFCQGVFTPGIFAVTVAYINEEWEEGVGAAMSAYVTGTVLGGFCGRMLAALIAARSSWRWSFFVLAIFEVLGALGMWMWLPGDRHRPAARRGSAGGAMLRHLRNAQLLATYGVALCVFFTLVASFTYVNFYLAAPPFRLSTTALGLLFSVYLVGAVITPIAGRAIDRMGHRFAVGAAFTGGVAGILMTLTPHIPVILCGLALCCTAVFIAQSAGSSYVGIVAHEAQAAAVGLYVTFYYAGGSLGASLPGLLWSRGGWPACVALIAAAQLGAIAIATMFWQPHSFQAPSSLRTSTSCPK